ncbi:MAG: hypothetical protein IT462_04955 [Planctomycetes bacterium]|nr:hypothetical protein [Planctomycetota bacterium]
MNRVLTITRAALAETFRSPTALLSALGLLALVPVLTFLGGQDEGARVWLSRTLLVEGLRLALPLGACLGGAWLLRVTMKRGWATLPARRGEWFAGAALAGIALMTLAAAFLAAGALAAATLIGSSALAVQTATPKVLRSHGQRPVTAGPGQRMWLATKANERLVFEFAKESSREVEGVIAFEMALTGDGAPGRDIPFTVQVGDSLDDLVDAPLHAEARKRASFIARGRAGATMVVLTPRDPAVLVGVYPDSCRLVIHREHPALSALWLALQGLAAGALCLALVMFVRARSTAPTAALAGLLLFSALTLLPGMSGAGSTMFRDKQAAFERTQAKETGGKKLLVSFIAALPPLCPAEGFEAYIDGRTVEGGLIDALWRALAALALLPLGALIFARRQIN